MAIATETGTARALLQAAAAIRSDDDESDTPAKPESTTGKTTTTTPGAPAVRAQPVSAARLGAIGGGVAVVAVVLAWLVSPLLAVVVLVAAVLVGAVTAILVRASRRKEAAARRAAESTRIPASSASHPSGRPAGKKGPQGGPNRRHRWMTPRTPKGGDGERPGTTGKGRRPRGTRTPDGARPKDRRQRSQDGPVKPPRGRAPAGSGAPTSTRAKEPKAPKGRRVRDAITNGTKGAVRRIVKGGGTGPGTRSTSSNGTTSGGPGPKSNKNKNNNTGGKGRVLRNVIASAAGNAAKSAVRRIVRPDGTRPGTRPAGTKHADPKFVRDPKADKSKDRRRRWFRAKDKDTGAEPAAQTPSTAQTSAGPRTERRRRVRPATPVSNPEPKVFDRRKKNKRHEAPAQNTTQPAKAEPVNIDNNTPTGYEYTPDPVDARSVVNRIVQSEKKAAPYSSQKGNSMYAHTIDMTSPESKAQTMGSAADAARGDARRLSEQADEFRAQAAALDDKPGMGAQAEEFRAQARKLDEDSQQRTGMARAYDEAASQYSAERNQ